MSTLSCCTHCGDLLAPWEETLGGCACRGPHGATNAELLYAVACRERTALPIHDLVRFAQDDYGASMGKPVANAVLAPDPRFCWAGKGVYGLYRHGVLPGPRNLEDVARMVLMAAGPLHMDVVDFILKQLGYRFAVGSLRNAVTRSRFITLDTYNWSIWSHPTGEAARRALRQEIPAVPDRQAREFDEIIERLGNDARAFVIAREQRIAQLPATVHEIAGIDWSDG